MEFKDRLKAERLKRGITQQQLADAIFVSRSAVAKWESGLGTPNEGSYKDLLAYFGLTEDELPLHPEVQELLVSKNEKIHKLSEAIVALCILSSVLLAVIAVVLLLPPDSKAESYNWGAVDALLDEVGREDNLYLPDGSTANELKTIDIYFSQDEEASTYVRLTKVYNSNADDYYELLFERHYNNLVEGKIVSVGYACSFHYNDEPSYKLELADVNYFVGSDESAESFRPCNTYHVQNLKISDGQFVSCDFEAVGMIGDGVDHDFRLPGGDERYLIEIMQFGFEKATEFFEGYDLPTPY